MLHSNHRSCPRILSLACFCSCFCLAIIGTPLLAQPPDEIDRLKTTAQERSLAELLEALSERDGTNFDVVFSAGGVGGGMRPNTFSGSIKADPRVQKIYRELSRLPRSEAEAALRDAFASKLKAVQDEGPSLVGHYGLNATFYLLAQFARDDVFNDAFEKWLSWGTSKSEELIELGRRKEAEAAKKGEKYQAAEKHAWKLLLPELPVYLDSLANRRLRSGASADEVAEELHDALNRAGAHVTKEDILRSLRRNADAAAGSGEKDENAKDEVLSWDELIHFGRWPGSTHIFDYPESVLALHRLKSLVDPPTLAERIQIEALQAGIEMQRRKTSLRREEYLKRQREANKPLEKGARLRFVRGPSRIFDDEGVKGVVVEAYKLWPADRFPNKREWVTVVKSLYESLPDLDRERWEPAYTEAIEWAKSLSDDGLTVDERKKYRWPVPKNENSRPADAKTSGEPNGAPAEFTIDFEIIEGELLKGPMPSDNDLNENDE